MVFDRGNKKKQSWISPSAKRSKGHKQSHPPEKVILHKIMCLTFFGITPWNKKYRIPFNNRFAKNTKGHNTGHQIAKHNNEAGIDYTIFLIKTSQIQ